MSAGNATEWAIGLTIVPTLAVVVVVHQETEEGHPVTTTDAASPEVDHLHRTVGDLHLVMVVIAHPTLVIEMSLKFARKNSVKVFASFAKNEVI